jgi:hypothetical protein
MCRQKNPMIILFLLSAPVPVQPVTPGLGASATLDEELSDLCFEIRHAKAEIDERKRWQLPLKSAGQKLEELNFLRTSLLS